LASLEEPFQGVLFKVDVETAFRLSDFDRVSVPKGEANRTMLPSATNIPSSVQHMRPMMIHNSGSSIAHQFMPPRNATHEAMGSHSATHFMAE